MYPENTPGAAPPDRPVPFTEPATLLPDDKLFALSDKLIDENYDAYRELSK